MRKVNVLPLWLVAVALWAVLGPASFGCGADGADASSVPEPGSYAVCERSERVGGFAVELRERDSQVLGSVTDGVNPLEVWTVAMEQGSCQLLRPNNRSCDPACESGTTCDADLECVPIPRAQDVGTVTMTGLASAVEMEPRPPSYRYFDNQFGHPGFEPGAHVALVAAGSEAYPEFSLATVGVEPLVVPEDTVPLAEGEAVVLSWTPGEVSGSVGIEIVLNIANHGGTPGMVECQVDDSGSFEIPVAITDALLDLGYSGFPSVTLTRQGAAAIGTELGCVDLRLRSSRALPVEIPGLVSCSTDADCPDGQRCELTLLACQ